MVAGTSIMGLMMLAAGQGHSILIETEGTDARLALDALIALVEGGLWGGGLRGLQTETSPG
jgi:phosphocarrier protein HPr